MYRRVHKISYCNPIKQQPLKLSEKKQQKKHSVSEGEGQSFTDIFAMYNKKILDLGKIIDYCMTSKPWAIVSEDEKSCNNNKHLF